MRKLMNVLVVALVAGPALVLGQAGDVNKVLADMRQALGGADKLSEVRSLTAVGTSQRTNPAGSTTEGDVELAMELPDKYVSRSVLAALGNMSIYRSSGFNGDGVINEIENPPNLAGGGGMIHIRTADPGDTGQEPSPEQKAAADMRMVMAAKKDFARLTVGMFGASYDAFPLQFRYGGQAESPDGKADVVDVTGPDNFSARLFVDTQTHLPLMLSWMDQEPRVVTQTMRSGGPGGGSGNAVQMGRGGTLSAAGRGGEPPSGEMRQMQAGAEAERPMVEFRIYYSNYKTVGGIRLPHTLQRSVDGKPTEETTFEQIKINPKIDSKKFAVTK